MTRMSESECMSVFVDESKEQTPTTEQHWAEQKDARAFQRNTKGFVLVLVLVSLQRVIVLAVCSIAKPLTQHHSLRLHSKAIAADVAFARVFEATAEQTGCNQRKKMHQRDSMQRQKQRLPLLLLRALADRRQEQRACAVPISNPMRLRLLLLLFVLPFVLLFVFESAQAQRQR